MTPALILALPLIAQTTTYDCGPTALLSVLNYWSVSKQADAAKLYPLLETTTKDGTDPVHLVSGAKSFGLEAGLYENMTREDLKDALWRGDTVILDVQAWRDEKTKGIPWEEDWEDGHYVVLAGIDDKNAYVMDPSTHGSYAWLPLDELMERWHDYEDRTGTVTRYRRLGIVIRGSAPLPPPARIAAASRMD